MSSRSRAIALLRDVRNWDHFSEVLRGLGEKQKGDAFEALVRHFLLLDPKYATILKHLWTLEEVPPKVREHLNLPGLDEGIDLVAQTNAGEFWAIQCKYRGDETKSLTRGELATFTDLAFDVCKNVALALVCTNASRFSRKLRLYGERLEFCSGDVWQALGADFFDRVRAFVSGQKVRIEPRQPLPHQQRCIQKAHDHFISGSNARGKLIMPCGTGKSLTAYWIAVALEAKRILVAVPSLALLRQSLEVWTRESVAMDREINWIAVCSDESVGDVDVSFLTQDLGVRVHTDPQEIAAWLSVRRSGLNVVFTTYQSGEAVAYAARLARVEFNLGIMDEAHRTTGRQDGLFSHLLHEHNIRIRRRIFMTATERQYRGQSEQIVSMDDCGLYGGTIESLSFKTALDARPPILSDYKILTVIVTREEVADLIRQKILVQPDKGTWRPMDAETLAAAIVLRKAMEEYPIRHAISFHRSVARAKSFQNCQDSLGDVYPKCRPLHTFHVSGAMPAGNRSSIMHAFVASEPSLVTNARCLTEGVDVPEVDCVLFADPRNSAVDIVQAIGRALRPSDQKECAYVVVPVLAGRDELNEQALTSAFAPLLTVLRALGANDERIIEYFRAVDQGVEGLSGGLVCIDVPLGIGVDVDAFVRSIETQCWSRLARLSWRPFDSARAYVHSLRLASYTEWKAYAGNKLPREGPLPEDIPRAPDQVYKTSGWVSWGDWFGTGVVASQERKFRPFADAREFVHLLGLKSNRQWLAYCGGAVAGLPPRPDDIPSLPSGTYSNAGWSGWGDWLGTDYVANRRRRYLPFAKARAFARRLGLRNEHEWRQQKDQLLAEIPKKPEVVYKGKGWAGWGDWLGSGRIANQRREFLTFEEARQFVHALNLKGYEEWQLYRVGKHPGKDKRPLNIPSDPYGHYKDEGWVSWPDWLGLGRKTELE